MKLIGIIDEDFLNYKKISMTLEFPYCNFKCDKECGQQVCQNSELAAAPNIEVNEIELIQKYLYNPITEAIVCQGLEPFDSILSLINFIYLLRVTYDCHDDIVIYTGYTKEEIDKMLIPVSQEPLLTKLKNYDNIIIKMGRYIPNQPSRYDPILGVTLASDNQYAERIS